jgi:TonB family protein
MALSSLLFSSDEATAEPIRHVLAGLGVDGEYCSEAAEAIEKVRQKNFQIVIIDWDKQPDAGLLLTTARERKASERPLTLAIVSDDASIPKALQAGANSILRKPLQGAEVKDTLATARDLLRAREESATAIVQAAAAGASATASAHPVASAIQREQTPSPIQDSSESPLSITRPNFVARSNAPEFVSHFEATESRDSAPAAASAKNPPVGEEIAARPSYDSSSPDRPKGLEWYLKTRAGAPAPLPEPAQAAPGSANPELLGFDQIPLPVSQPATTQEELASGSKVSESKPKENSSRDSKKPDSRRQDSKPNSTKVSHRASHGEKEKEKERGEEDGNNEEELFAYIEGEKGEPKSSQPTSRLKGAIIAALVLAGCAIAAAPQAPWHSKMRAVWARGQQTTHLWLNPQPVTPVQAPVAHENFGRAGDEYKLPVEENIPDATTDPSQIQVVPVVDPTAKKPNSDAVSPGQPTAQPDGTGATTIQTPASGSPSPEQVSAPIPDTGQPGATAGQAAPTIVPPIAHSDPPAALPTVASAPFVPVQVAPKVRPPREPSSPGNVPSSLRSQVASMTPDASGNKPAEAAMDSIEPVALSEATERALLTEQPAFDYPANAKGQRGTVILQVLIGRDGTVQDAKFLQGSLAFARAAIDGVKQWKFKPYAMNGRAVSVQTLLTLSFKPAS